MVSVTEAANAVTQGNADAGALTVLALDQTLTFTQYTRKVLPLDGYVFWLRTTSTTVRGSLHTTMTKRQLEDETATINRVVLSTATQVQTFNDIGSDTIWVGSWDGIRFAFTVADSVYEAANLWHYVGEAVYPALSNMLVDTGAQLSDADLIVSNSLPAWLSLKTYAPVWLLPDNPGVELYPSFLVPDNIRPPYGVVHIDGRDTIGLQATPYLLAHTFTPGVPFGSFRGADHYQLVKDRVRITLYGLTNERALDFLDLVYSYSLDTDAFGIMSVTPMRDEKRTQAELGILAMKKTFECEVSYYQARINDVARQLLLHAIVSYFPSVDL